MSCRRIRIHLKTGGLDPYRGTTFPGSPANMKEAAMEISRSIGAGNAVSPRCETGDANPAHDAPSRSGTQVA